MSFVAVIVVFAFTNTVSAKCGPQQHIRAVSTNGVFELNIGPNNQFKICRKGIIVASGEIEISGHHNIGFIDDAGSFFVLHDNYDGLAIYDAKGQRLGRFVSKELLSVREQWTRPGKWACHPEGQWSRESNPLSFGSDGTSICVLTHSGRRILIDLQSPRVVNADHDFVQLAFVAGASLLLLGGICLWRILKRKRPTCLPSLGDSPPSPA